MKFFFTIYSWCAIIAAALVPFILMFTNEYQGVLDTIRLSTIVFLIVMFNGVLVYLFCRLTGRD